MREMSNHRPAPVVDFGYLLDLLAANFTASLNSVGVNRAWRINAPRISTSALNCGSWSHRSSGERSLFAVDFWFFITLLHKTSRALGKEALIAVNGYGSIHLGGCETSLVDHGLKIIH